MATLIVFGGFLKWIIIYHNPYNAGPPSYVNVGL